ncbi:ATP-binding cassette sub- D member 4, variant 3 [Balamuthia mandrillaris]
MSSLLNRVLIVPFQVVYYSYACGQLLGYMAPLLIYSFFVVATAVNKLLADPVLPLVVSQEASEAHFRHFHARVRANAESIAFQNGEKAEGTRASIHLGHLYNTSKAVILRRLFVQCSSEFFVYSGAILNYVLIALPIFAGDYDHIDSSMLAKHISQSSFYTLYLIHSFTTIIALWSDICLVGGYTSRLAQLFQHSESVGKGNSLPHHLGPATEAEDEEGKKYNQMKVWNEQDKQEDIRLLEAGGYLGRMESCFVDADVLGFAGATCCTPFPPFVCLVKELDLEVKSGVNVLIEGPSGCGKSSLLRVLKGLWPITSGHVLRPKNEEEVLFFLPQMPYVFPGTLWELIAYPSLFNSSSATTRLHLEEALSAACLQDLSFRLSNGSFSSSSLMLNNAEAKMMNGNNSNEEKEEMAASVVVDWEQVLSPGERQRIGMARLFFHRPRFAVLDEATSALSLQQEASVYERCGEMGTTLLSVGHRPSLRRFHHFLLRIETKDGEMNQEKEEDETKEKGQEGEMEKGTPMNSIRRRRTKGGEGGQWDKLGWTLAPIHHG